ncbi:MAG TPA: MerR family transcriptional regulator [Thermoanaerobaculia bacterium]|nr:MerR family transcriptional regulator [Thermoanaerobaculia bacterium]
MSRARLTISDVHRKTGIPVTTLRFYEKELPEFFHVEKTAGGHRRYSETSITQFQMIRRMVEQDGLRLGQIRERLAPATDAGEMRRQVDLLLSVHEAMADEIDRLRGRVEALEMELAGVKRGARPSQAADKKRRWF